MNTLAELAAEWTEHQRDGIVHIVGSLVDTDVPDL